MNASIMNSENVTKIRLRDRLHEFFFAEETPFGLAVLRILIGIACLLVTAPRWIYTRELYSLDGAPAPLADNYGFFNLLPIPSGGVAVALMTILTFACFTTCIGWCTRISTVIAAVLYTYLNLLDSLSTMTKYSVITSHVLFLLSVSQCGAVWSVDSWLRRCRLGLPQPRTLADYPKFAAWPRRLTQILIGVVYFGASLTKMHTPAYFSGDQLLHWMMTNVNNANPIGEWMTLFPQMLVLFAYVGVVWEVLFLFLSWNGWGRICMLALGVLFHIMTTLTLGLYLFPITCIAIYFSFLNSDDVVNLAARWRRFKRLHLTNWQPRLFAATAWPRAVFRFIDSSLPRRQRLSPTLSVGVFGLVAMGVTVGAVEIEYRLDPYGVRRNDGPHALRELDPEQVKLMFAGDQKLREYDKYLAFDLGTDMFGGMVTGQKETFHHGETIIAQYTLSPPHEDMWVECNLHDANNVLLDRVGQVVVRSQLRGNFVYRACEALRPGDYFLVLRTGGQEITRRKIQIVEGACRVMAN
ncbi:MAG: HTTM domain-containing protein [Planctomycetia bacterium]|nr:HTTM domain-containing protein [Planctomycetia bacterium]